MTCEWNWIFSFTDSLILVCGSATFFCILIFFILKLYWIHLWILGVRVRHNWATNTFTPRGGNGYPLQYSSLENSRPSSLVGCKKSHNTEQLTLSPSYYSYYVIWTRTVLLLPFWFGCPFSCITALTRTVNMSKVLKVDILAFFLILQEKLSALFHWIPC